MSTPKKQKKKKRFRKWGILPSELNNFTEIIPKLKSQFIDVLLLNLPKLDVMFLAVKTFLAVKILAGKV